MYDSVRVVWLGPPLAFDPSLSVVPSYSPLRCADKHNELTHSTVDQPFKNNLPAGAGIRLLGIRLFALVSCE